MQPQPIFLYRRRWTLLFQVPFVLIMAVCFVFSVFLIYASDERLVVVIGSVAAFSTFCIGWTLGSASLTAYRVRAPAVVIDENGITDLRDDPSRSVPWDAMERVHLDNQENVILVRLRPGHKDSALGVIVKALQRWQQRGDVVFFLHGLAYDTRQIQTTLKAFHTAAAPKPRVL